MLLPEVAFLEREVSLVIKNSYRTVDLSGHIKEWSKNKRHLFKLFGEKLKIESTASIPLPKEEVSGRLKTFIRKIQTKREYFLVSMFLSILKLEDVQKNILSRDLVFFQTTFKAGSKVSRILSKICHPSIADKIQTEYSLFLQSLKGTGTLVLSIDPLDYIFMSEKTTGWRSCQSLDGDYRTGGFALMQDYHTVVAYARTSEGKKSWRQLVFIDMDNQIAIQSRQYPAANSSNNQIVGEMIRSLFKEYFNANDFTSYPMGTADLEMFVQDCEDDYGNKLRLWYNDILSGSFSEGYLICRENKFPLTKNGEDLDIYTFSDNFDHDPIYIGSSVKCICGCCMDLDGSDALFCYDEEDEEQYDEDEEEEE